MSQWLKKFSLIIICIQIATCISSQNSVRFALDNPCGFDRSMTVNNLKEQLRNFEKNKPDLDSAGYRCMGYILLELAQVYEREYKIEPALAKYDEAYKTLTSINHHDLLWNIRIKRGRMLLRLNDLEASRVDFKASLHHLTEKSDSEKVIISYMNISATFDSSQADSIIFYSKKSIDHHNRNTRKIIYAVSYNNLAWGYLQNNQPQKALEIVQKNIDIKTFNKDDLGNIYNALMHTLGKSYLKLERYQDAIDKFDKIVDDLVIYSRKITTLKDRALAHKKLRNFDRALQDQNEIIKLLEVVDSIDISRELAKFEYNSLLSSKDNTIDQLEQINILNIKKINKIEWIIYSLAVFSVILGIFFYLKQNRQKLDLYRTNEQLYIVRLNSLRKIMNPHFLFNVFSTLQNFILNKNYLIANDYMTELSEMIREVIATSNSLYINLSKEISIIESYLNLEQQRFKNEFKWSINLDASIDENQTLIPSMIIQPFLENAIIHGFSDKKSGKTLLISFKKDHHYLNIEIIDNGIGRAKAKELKEKYDGSKNLNTATKNIEQRLALLEKLTANEHIVETYDLEDEFHEAAGTKVVIKLPIMKEHDK